MHRIVVPNSASLHNLRHVLTSMQFFPEAPEQFELVFHPQRGHMQPFMLAMLGAWAHHWLKNGVSISCTNAETPWVRYLTRMGLFEALKVDAPSAVTEHESAGRFIPLRRLDCVSDVKTFIADTVPLLHHSQHPDALTYCLSELTRNVFEHAGGVPAFACAQYYPSAQRVSIGVADTGIGILGSMSQTRALSSSDTAIMAALTAGVSGKTPGMYGSADNAGAGLFFTKAIAQLSSGFFALYSGDAAFRLRKPRKDASIAIYSDPARDRHDLFKALPVWHGTVLGVDVASHVDDRFDRYMNRIRTVFREQAPRRSKPKIKFT